MRRWILSVCILLVFFGMLLIGIGSWLLRSTDGASWLIKTVADAVDVQITTGQLEGRLADELVISDLLVAWPGGQITTKRLRLDWALFSVIKQTLHVRTLEVEQLVISAVTAADVPESKTDGLQTSDFAAGDLAFLPAWLTVQIDRLQIQGLVLQGDDDAVIIADEISGNYLWSHGRIEASQFNYLSPFVQLRGSFDWDLQQPHLEMTADVHLPDTLVEPQLFKDIAVPVDFPALLELDGDWNGFSGPVRFGTVAEDGDSVWLTAESNGSWQGIRFDNLQGRYLKGALAGELELEWIDSYRMNGELSGNGLEPGVLVKDLEGKARLDLSGELLVPYDATPLQASLGAVIHEGQLRGHTIAGNLAADWQNGGLHKIDLDLTGDDARVVARGKPAERVDLDLAVGDLSPFYPGLAGQLAATGWLRWSDHYLTGEAQGSGANILWQGTSLAHLNFNASHLTQKGPLALQLDGQGLQYADLQVEHMLLGLSGTLAKHVAQITVTGLAGDLAIQLAGQYRDEVWQAELQSLSGQTEKLGIWHLEAPTHIMWQSGVLNLEDFSLASDRGENVTFKLSDFGATTQSRFAMTWHDLSYAWLEYLQPSHGVSGRSSGKLLLEMAGQLPISLQAELNAAAEFENAFSVVTVPVLTAEMNWLKDGLALSIAADSNTGEHFEATAHSSQPPSWSWPPEQLSLDMHWQGVNLERISRLYQGLEANGHSEGRAQLDILRGQLLHASASISAEGLMQQKNQPVGFRSVLADLNWDDERFQCTAHVVGAHGGLLDISLTSKDSPRFAWPDSGQIELSIDNVNLQSLDPLLQDEITLDGVLRGKSGGYWQEDGELFLDGLVKITDGGVTLNHNGGQVDLQMQQADIDWHWQGDHLTGSMALQLAKQGELHGSWQLPLPARWPIIFDADAELQASLQGQLHAIGMLAALYPGLVQDLHGQVQSDLQVTGSWNAPVFSGQLALLDAGAYSPATGVTIESFEVRAALHGNQVKIEKFSLRSGPGTLDGSGEIEFDRWQLEHYQLAVKGERLQVYNFPELQVFCSPDLTLSGDLEKLQLEGRVLIPEMTLLGSSTVPEVMVSKDVVISGEAQDRHRDLPIDADIQVDVELGDQVRIKTAGVNTRLQGGGRITLDQQGHLVIWGEINLFEGVYKAYGANLGIKQGVLRYKGGPVENPSLSILATREVGTVQAGVQVTGTAEAPVVTLYSQPAMPERDILGYIFMGRPMRTGQEGEDALMIGAGALVPGYGGAFSDLGISEIDIQGLFDGTGGVTVRKRLTEKWEVESTLGAESGVDLFYLIKFD